MLVTETRPALHKTGLGGTSENISALVLVTENAERIKAVRTALKLSGLTDVKIVTMQENTRYEDKPIRFDTMEAAARDRVSAAHLNREMPSGIPLLLGIHVGVSEFPGRVSQWGLTAGAYIKNKDSGEGWFVPSSTFPLPSWVVEMVDPSNPLMDSLGKVILDQSGRRTADPVDHFSGGVQTTTDLVVAAALGAFCPFRFSRRYRKAYS